MKNMIGGLIIALALISSAVHADFINLDFESYSGSGSDLLPGWERGTNNYMWPLFDQLPIATAGLGLVSTNIHYSIDGKYSLFLSLGCEQGNPTSGPCPVSIWQTAQVPTDAAFLAFTIDSTNSSCTYSFTLGSLDLLGSTPVTLSNGYLRFSTDISSLAGQTQTLTIAGAGLGAVWTRIDDFVFSPVPEPGTWLLLLSGLGFLSSKFVLVRRQKR